MKRSPSPGARSQSVSAGPGSRRSLGAAAVCALVAGLGCSTAVSGEPGGDELGATRALIRIERIETLAPDGARAYALAHFAQVKGAAPRHTLELLDLGEALPEVGSCIDGRSGEAPDAWSTTGQVELLEAGEVTISTPTQVTSLAPRAFPTVRDLVSGVVYSSRDQAAEPLPSGTPYRVSASGSSVFAPIDVMAEAPEALSEVYVGGLSLSELSELPLAGSVPLRWAPSDSVRGQAGAAGQAGDWVVFELTDGLSRVVCSFDDRAGKGVVPSGVIESSGLTGGSATLSLHRVRVATFGDEASTLGEIRFDFEIAAPVQLR
ncbi:MAG: hypothetical protein KF915_07745 [Polyangiaceae bacterium]|nr:hypothetical protein [Polyangiaceae bacterium]